MAFRRGISGIGALPSLPEAQQPHAVVDEQCGDRAQRDAGERQIACVPGEVGDADDQRDGCGHLVDRLAKSTWLVSQIRTPRTPTRPYSTIGRAAEHAGRYRRDRGADLRAQRQHDGHRCGDPVRRRRVHPGGRHDADVLGVGRGGRTAAETGEHRRDPVGGECAADQRVGVRVGHLADRLHVSDVLGDQGDDSGQEHRQHRQRERRGLELGQAQPRRRRDPRRVDVAEGQRQQVPGHDRDEDRQPADDAAEERQGRHQQHQRDEADERTLLEVRLRRGREVEADQRDDRTGDHRWQRHVDPVGADEVHDRADDDQQ